MSSLNALLNRMCQPVDPAVRGINPLRVNPNRAQELLNDPRYKGVDTSDLIELASEKVKGVTDRCTEIAVLRGVN